MSIQSIATRTLGISALAAFLAAPVLAHHGWSWAEEEQMELSGTVSEVRIAPPHPSIQLETEDDGTWRIELGNPNGTARAGFDESSTKPGDEITVIGNRSQDQSEKRMKAVQVIVGDKTYDIYPERVQN